jgi:hypothetical protein
MDLLTADEEEDDRRTRKLRVDIGLLPAPARRRRLPGRLLGSGELRVRLFGPTVLLRSFDPRSTKSC